MKRSKPMKGSGWKTVIGKSYKSWYNELKALWCECPPLEDGFHPEWEYHDDDEDGAIMSKHHYTCTKCKGLTQIG